MTNTQGGITTVIIKTENMSVTPEPPPPPWLSLPPPTPVSGDHRSVPSSYHFAFSGMPSQGTQPEYSFLRPASFSSAAVVCIPACSSLSRNSTHCWCHRNLLLQLSGDGQLGCLQLGVIMDEAAYVFIHEFSCKRQFPFLGYILSWHKSNCGLKG